MPLDTRRGARPRRQLCQCAWRTVCALVFAAALGASPAHATEVAVGVGADVWTAGNASGPLRLGAEVAYLTGGAEFVGRFAFAF